MLLSESLRITTKHISGSLHTRKENLTEFLAMLFTLLLSHLQMRLHSVTIVTTTLVIVVLVLLQNCVNFSLVTAWSVTFLLPRILQVKEEQHMLKKVINVGGKEVEFRSSATVPRLYRAKFKRDIFKDLAKLESSYKGSNYYINTLQQCRGFFRSQKIYKVKPCQDCIFTNCVLQ